MSYPYTPPPSAPYPPPYGMSYGPPPVGQYQPPQRRSAIPRVVGILAIVFAPIGLLITLAMTFGPKDDFQWMDITQGELGFFGSWLDIYLVLGLALFALHLVGGIMTVAYKKSGPPLLSAYAIAAIVLAVADVFISMGTLSVSDRWVYQELVYPRLFIELFALPWPIVAVILINVRKAKEACGRYSDKAAA